MRSNIPICQSPKRIKLISIDAIDVQLSILEAITVYSEPENVYVGVLIAHLCVSIALVVVSMVFYSANNKRV